MYRLYVGCGLDLATGLKKKKENIGVFSSKVRHASSHSAGRFLEFYFSGKKKNNRASWTLRILLAGSAGLMTSAGRGQPRLCDVTTRRCDVITLRH